MSDESSPAEPESSPAEPKSSPAEPKSSPAEPESSPAEPESSPAEPESSSVEPVETPAAAKPVLRVVKGDLTAEELAALVAVVAARNAAAANAAARTKPKVRSKWGHPAELARKPHRVGPDQWRRSTFGG